MRIYVWENLRVGEYVAADLKLGERFRIEGEGTFEVCMPEVINSCQGCYFSVFSYSSRCRRIGCCIRGREDNQDVIFKKVEE